MELYELRQRQSLPLAAKIDHSVRVIRTLYDHFGGDVSANFSGGICSDVLYDITRQIYPQMPFLMVNTKGEYGEVIKHVHETPGVKVVSAPAGIDPSWVIENHGYPLISKKTARGLRQLQNPTPGNEGSRILRLTGITADGSYNPRFMVSKKWQFLKDAPFPISERCCEFLKKRPGDKWKKENGVKAYFLGTMASESSERERAYLRNGCNVFEGNDPHSTPLAIWTTQDILEYILRFKVPYASVYGDIIEGPDGKLTTTREKHTGCVWCMFGVHLEQKPNRFQRLEKYHPKLWNYCTNTLGCGRVMDYIGIDYHWHDSPKQSQLL